MPATTPANPLATHNGLFTISNPKTGEHRTFRIRTQPKDAKFAPNMRVIALLTGPDNGHDYTRFGFVIEGKVRVWSKFRATAGNPTLTTVWERYAAFLNLLSAHLLEERVSLQLAGSCRVCNRTLTEPESIRAGIGPVCAQGGA